MTAQRARVDQTAFPQPELHRRAWVEFLRGRVSAEWRIEEFDPESWFFTGDPANPMTTTRTCKVARCGAVLGSQTFCHACRSAFDASDQPEQEFIATFRPRPPRRRSRLTGQTCVVTRDGVACRRRRNSNLTGICPTHGSDWCRYRDGGGALSFEQWCTELARPLPPLDPCLVSGCPSDTRLDVQLCGHHHRRWRRSQAGRAHHERVPPERWAARQLAHRPHSHQFSLAMVAPTVRWELLYALQQRDRLGQKLDPVAMRGLIAEVGELDSIAAASTRELASVLQCKGAIGAFGRLLIRIIALTFEGFRGIDHLGKDVWDCLALDLESPRPGRRANMASIDFTPIRQLWMRDAVKDWVHGVRPDSHKLRRTLLACTVASRALAHRPGGGDIPSELTFADMTAVFEAIQTAKQGNGELFNSHYRRGLWSRWHEILDYGRSTGALAELAGTFHRHSSQTIPDDEINEDEIGKAIPETVIAQLDAQLHLLEADYPYGKQWAPTDTSTMFHAAYQILRDTGRRPGELVTLRADCLELDGGEYALVYDNLKQRRLRRRLPITRDTAAVIQRWQARHTRLDLPERNRRWLFPAPYESSGPGHLTTIRFATGMRRWVAAIPALHSDLPGPDGSPLPFERSLIFPYAFRHSYAQRHADAGVGVEVLKELMDHTDISVTQGYYKVGLKRKREAIKVMSRYVQDRSGESGTGSSCSTARYELRSVAVPFGNCIEPSNVKAGGKQCPIRFQCAGCGFYRPDPSYLPAIEEHINALKADRETAAAMGADDFITRNLDDQAEAFSQVAATMRQRLQDLPNDERAEVEQASAVLRKVRAGRAHKLLPLTVKDSA